MPRPKRSKVTPSVPTQRILPSTTVANSKAMSSPQSSVRDTTNSDDSEGLVKRNKTGLNRNGVARKDVFMSGALGPEDVGGKRLKPPTGRQRAALSRIARETDHTRAIEALKRKREEALAKEREKQVVVPSSMPEVDVAIKANATSEKIAELSTMEGEPPTPSAKVKATPVTDSSLLALANFKRRSRQPSILQIGRHDEPEAPIDSDEELHEFEPDDESTPFHLSHPRSHLQSTPKSHLTSSSSQRSSCSNSRKRKLAPPELQVRRSQSPPVQAPSAILHVETPIRPDTSLCNSPTAEEVLEPELPPIRPHRAQTPDIWSDTMAPPQSSSPTHDVAESARSIRIVKARVASVKKANRQQPTRNLVAESPAPNSKTSKKVHPLKTITTASLQNLIPHRRRRAPRREASEFDIPSSSDAELEAMDVPEDEDELSSAAPLMRKIRGKAKDKVVRDKEMKKGVGGKAQLRQLPQALTTGKSKTKQNTPTKTYTRHVSDKENAALSKSDSSSLSEISTNTDIENTMSSPLKCSAPSPRKTSKELRTIAKKFKEIDQWALEFEEVTASSSSPRDAR